MSHTNNSWAYSEDDVLFNLNGTANHSDGRTNLLNSTANSDGNTTTGMEEEEYYKADVLALVLPRVTAVVSIFAVVCVAIESFMDLRSNRRSSNRGSGRSTASASNFSTVTYIQFFYQIPLFFHALAFALGTTPAPSVLDVWGAVGNIYTCETQGFLLQFGILGNIGWDIALSTAYLMMVRCNYSSYRLQSWHKYYHLAIWPSVLALCIYPLVKDMYNINHSVCWLESYPNDCVGEECIRGAGAPLWQTLISMLGVLHLLYSVIVMICIYCAIRGIENRNQRYNFESSNNFSSNVSEAGSIKSTTTTNPNRRYSRAVGVQGMLYASGMIITILPTVIYITLYNITGLWSPGFGIFATSMTPLLGYVNFVIFMRNRSVMDCHTSYAKFLRRANGWIWDLRLNCHCQCQCQITYDGKNSAGADTASATKSKRRTGEEDQSDQNSRRKRAPRLSSNERSDLSRHRPLTLPSINEEESVEDSQSQGTWIGASVFRKVSEWVSDLGTSELEEDCLGTPPSPFIVEDDLDGAPSVPQRRKSRKQTPPLNPSKHVDGCTIEAGNLHFASEISELTGTSEFEHTCTSDGAPSTPTRQISQKKLIPPVKAENRGAMGASSEVSSGDEMPSLPTRRISRAKIPPPRPMRVDSCPDLMSVSDDETDCIKPVRSATASSVGTSEDNLDLSPTDGLPTPFLLQSPEITAPQRSASELGERHFDDESSVPMGLMSQSSAPSDAAIIGRSCAVESVDTGNTGGGPPTKPVRNATDGSDADDYAEGEGFRSSFAKKGEEGSPIKHVRIICKKSELISPELEDDHFEVAPSLPVPLMSQPSAPLAKTGVGTCAMQNATSRSNNKETPMKPVRNASGEYDVGANSEEGKIQNCLAKNRKVLPATGIDSWSVETIESGSNDGLPPTKPMRHTSEESYVDGHSEGDGLQSRFVELGKVASPVKHVRFIGEISGLCTPELEPECTNRGPSKPLRLKSD